MTHPNVSRRSFLKQTASACSALSLPVLFTGCESKKTPNILWLISEDTSPDLACYGNKLVKTPHLDGLAKQGIRFTNAFATCPVCSPVRSGFMTGMYQTTIGAHNHRTRDKKPLPEPVKVITHFFRNAGYYTANITDPAPGVRGTGKTDWNFDPGAKPFDGEKWEELKTRQPFFAQVNFQMTHRAFKRDPENPVDPDDVQVPPYYPDHPVTRRDWADYLESLQVLDKDIGKVLKRLEDEGLADNTIVLYFGDHGRPHVRGKQWLYEGGIHVPLIVRWPGRLKPGQVNDALVSTIDFAPTCMRLAGITPPEHLQGNVFLGNQSKERKYIFAARDRCDETVDRIRCVRDKQFKYIKNFMPDRPYMQFNAYKQRQYPVFSLLQVLHKQKKLTRAQESFMAKQRLVEELYDLQADPHEINNLAEDPQYRDKLTEMRNVLNDWIVETEDKGEIPEPREETEYWQNMQSQRHEETLKDRGLTRRSMPEDYMKYWNKKLGLE